jgi:hypothetical protein
VIESDVALMTDTEVRRTLRGRHIKYSILAPFGAWLGCGSLRVLRVKPLDDDALDITLGYESYEKFDLGSPQ